YRGVWLALPDRDGVLRSDLGHGHDALPARPRRAASLRDCVLRHADALPRHTMGVRRSDRGASPRSDAHRHHHYPGPDLHGLDAADGNVWRILRSGDASARRYRRTLITNVNLSSLDVAGRTVAPGSTTVDVRPLEQAWPRDVSSLSHVAIPFPMSDPVYGRDETGAAPPTIRLGVLSTRGERGVLSVHTGTLL